MSIFAVYGNVALERDFCQQCQSFAFIIDGKLACCDSIHESIPKKVKRMSEPEGRRHRPSKTEQDRILEDQNGKCYYCGARFGSVVKRNGVPKLVKLNFDHKVPFRFSQNNDLMNFVACCNHCNAIKSDKVYDNEEQMQLEILIRLHQKGFSYASKALGLIIEDEELP